MPVQPGPESQGLTQRQVRVEGRALVEQGDGAVALNLARDWRQQSGKDAEQARLADPIGSAHVKGLAGFDCQRKPSEQHPVAAPAGYVTSGETCLHGLGG